MVLAVVVHLSCGALEGYSLVFHISGVRFYGYGNKGLCNQVSLLAGISKFQILELSLFKRGILGTSPLRFDPFTYTGQ
jgi:hypothetical protein